jgi:hypothetical protein
VRRGDGTRVRRVMVAGLCALMAMVGLGGSLLAQSPSPPVESSTVVETAVVDPFPTAEEISDILGVDVEARGIEEGLSQIWEGTILDWQTLPSAQLQIYASSTDEPQGPSAGVIIDIAHFGSADDAMRHVDDVVDDVVDDGQPGFATDLTGDFVATASFESDDGFGGSFMFLREGPVVVVATMFAAGATEMEVASEAVVALVLSRLHGDD